MITGLGTAMYSFSDNTSTHGKVFRGPMAGLAGGFGILSVGLHCSTAYLLGSSVSSQAGLVKQTWDS